ncbi:MAG: hypothetical protein V3R83_09925 [Gammaproteobacteria bacterium]
MISATDLILHTAVLLAALSGAMLCSGMARTGCWVAFTIQAIRLQIYVSIITDANSQESWMLYTATSFCLGSLRLSMAIGSSHSRGQGLSLPTGGWIVIAIMSVGAFAAVYSYSGEQHVVTAVALRFALACFMALLCMVALVDMIHGRNAIPFALLLSDSADFLLLAVSLFTPAMSAWGAFAVMHALEALPWGFLGYLGFCGSDDFCALRSRGGNASLERMETPEKTA